MTRTELVKSVKDKTGVTLDIAERTIAAIQASMIKSLKKRLCQTGGIRNIFRIQAICPYRPQSFDRSRNKSSGEKGRQV